MAKYFSKVEIWEEIYFLTLHENFEKEISEKMIFSLVIMFSELSFKRKCKKSSIFPQMCVAAQRWHFRMPSFCKDETFSVVL